MSPLRRLSIIAALSGACATPTTTTPLPSPAPEAPQESAAAAPATGAEPTPTPAPALDPAPRHDTAKAAGLVEQGRQLQRERGEDGAPEAIVLYQQALAADPMYAKAHWELGWSHQMVGDYHAAVRAWDELRALDPHFPELERYYPILLMRRDQRAKLDALPEPGALPEPELTPRPGPTLTFAAVGDVQMGRAWPAERATLPPDDARDFFADVAEALRKADVTFGNLETVLADDGDSDKCGPKSTKCFAFRVPASYAKALAEAGFDLLSIANNHAGDFGEAGRVATMKALDAVSLRYSGPVGVTASLESNGLTIGLAAFSTGQGVYRIQELDVARKVVADLDREHDIVVVSFHGGAEGTSAARVPKGPEIFYGESRGDVYAFAHAVVDAGADLVFGHGPHLFRGMEIYKGRLIAYSLGNFSTWETFNLTGPLGLTGILYATIAPNGVALEARLEPVALEKPGAPKLDPKRRIIDIVRKLSRDDFGDPLFDEKGRWLRRSDEAPVSASR